MFVDALLILTADCTSVRIDLQFDRDFFFFFLYRIKSAVLSRFVFVVVLVGCLFCFVFCCCFVCFLVCFSLLNLGRALCGWRGGHCVVGGEGTV